MDDVPSAPRPSQQRRSRSRSLTRSLRPTTRGGGGDDPSAGALLLKGMRYEEFKTGAPPRPVRSISGTARSIAALPPPPETMQQQMAVVQKKQWTVQDEAWRASFDGLGADTTSRAQHQQHSHASSPLRLHHQHDTTIPHHQHDTTIPHHLHHHHHPPPPSTPWAATTFSSSTSSCSNDSVFKRDSGIAPSPPTTAAASTSLRQQHYPQQHDPDRDLFWSPRRPPPLPAFAVQDERSDLPTARSILSYSSRAKRKASSRKRTARSVPPSSAKRMASFHGLDALPVTSTDDLSLGDLTSNKLQFSARGSLLFGGKKMQELISSRERAGGEPGVEAPRAKPSQQEPEALDKVEPALPDAEQTPVSPADVHLVCEQHTDDADKSAGAAAVEVASESGAEFDIHAFARSDGPTPAKEKRYGLAVGRRKPSMQMLQAAIHGGRVLSAEEMTFSMKVRTMYEHGDERAAEWALPSSTAMSFATSGKDTPETVVHDISTPEVVLHKARSYYHNNEGNDWPLTDHRASYMSKYSRTSNELAGGIEDWENIDGSLVDRYGFIHSHRGDSSGSSRSGPEGGIQRVATSLRLHPQQSQRMRERGPRRVLSSARSSRSLPPQSRDWSSRRGPGSVHSTLSTAPRGSKNLFRSRSNRLLADASDMLMLPPGLADIAEAEDAGTPASARKQREWKRGEKWQRMAKLVTRKNEGKGGGMHFDFDTTDPKLIARTWKGIPDRWRAAAWHSFLATSARRRGSRTTDEELIGQFHKLQGMSCADDVQIDIDVPRTVQLHIMFRRRYRGGQRLLFRVLHAMALYFPDVGYVQGMASIAVTLLCYFEEETAFVMMVRMWQLRGLESFFTENFSGLMAALAEFEQDWLSRGDVAQKLTELGITSTTYGTRWYLTLFNMSVPFPAQLRIWDVFMLLGDAPAATEASPETNAFGGADLDVLHATSAALIDATREILIDSDFENAMKVLTSFVPIQDEDILMQVAHVEYKLRKKRPAQVKAA